MMHTTLLFLVELKGRAQGLGQDGLDFAPAFLWGEKKQRTVCGCHKFLCNMFATDLKMGTVDHVPFYSALWNSL